MQVHSRVYWFECLENSLKGVKVEMRRCSYTVGIRLLPSNLGDGLPNVLDQSHEPSTTHGSRVLRLGQLEETQSTKDCDNQC